MTLKGFFFAMVLATMFTAGSLAQNVKAPATHLGGPGDPNFYGSPSWGNPPRDAAKLIFYGGDINVEDPTHMPSPTATRCSCRIRQLTVRFSPRTPTG